MEASCPSPSLKLAKVFESALQESNHKRELDSLETVIVKTILTSQGVQVPDNFVPETNTIAGWLEWIDRFYRST